MPRGGNYMPYNRVQGSRTRERLCDTLFRQDKSQSRRYSPYSSSRSQNRASSPLRSLLRESPSPARVRAGEAKEFIPGRERYYSPNSRRLYEAPIDWNTGDAYSIDDNHCFSGYRDCHSYNNNSDWMIRSSSSHKDHYRSDDFDEDVNIKRFRSPPRSEGALSIYSLSKRMDHFDSILTKLVNEVAEKKRYNNNQSTSPSFRQPEHQRKASADDMEKLDRLMDDLHIMRRHGSPAREMYRPVPTARSDSYNHNSRNRYRR